MAAFLIPTLSSPLFSLTTTPYAIAAGSSNPRRLHPPSTTRSSAVHNSTFRLPRSAHLSSAGALPPRGGGTRRDRRPDDSDGAGGYFGSATSVLAVLWRHYMKQLHVSPLRTKSLSAAFLVFLSDVLAQALSPSNNLDSVRLARFAVYGLLISGPQGHFWFQFLERVVKMPGTRGAVMKMVVDQMTFAPVATASFFGIMKLAEGETPSVTYQFLKDNLAATMMNSYKVWPLLNLINFVCVPVSQRVLFTSAASVFWVSFLSVVASRQAKPCA